tara:strand:- start:71 stop:328 length:258 start_codon:yes stop_codon:yes gene_type:complete
MIRIIETNAVNTNNAGVDIKHADVPTPSEEQALLAYDEEFRADFPTSEYALKREREEREEAWLLAEDGMLALLDENGQLPMDAFV